MLVNAVMNFRPQNAENLLTSLGPVSFSERTLLHGVSLFNRVADAVMDHCGIVIVSRYYKELSQSDYVITYRTANRLIISSAAARKVWSTDPKRSATSS